MSRKTLYLNKLLKYIPLFASFFSIILGWAVMLIIAPANVELPAPTDIHNVNVASNEVFARYKAGITFLFFLSVSIGVGCFAVIPIWTQSLPRQRGCWLFVWILYLSVTCLVLSGLDCFFGLNREYTFFDMFGKDPKEKSANIFELTIGRYPALMYTEFQNSNSVLLWLLEKANRLAYYAAIIAVTLLFSITCTLVPRRAYAILRKPRKHSRARRDRAARQIARQFLWLKYYLFAGAVLLVSALAYMSASREWPLSFFSASEAKEAAIFSSIVRSTIFFQAGHFVLILISGFLPIAVRLKSAGARLAELELPNLNANQRRSWMAERGLLFSRGDVLQQTLAIVSPFIVPVMDLIRTYLNF